MFRGGLVRTASPCFARVLRRLAEEKLEAELSEERLRGGRLG